MCGCVVSVNGNRMMKIRSNLSVSHFIVSIEACSSVKGFSIIQ